MSLLLFVYSMCLVGEWQFHPLDSFLCGVIILLKSHWDAFHENDDKHIDEF